MLSSSLNVVPSADKDTRHDMDKSQRSNVELFKNLRTRHVGDALKNMFYSLIYTQLLMCKLLKMNKYEKVKALSLIEVPYMSLFGISFLYLLRQKSFHCYS